MKGYFREAMNWTLVLITLINAVASTVAALFARRGAEHAKEAVAKIASLRPPAGDRSDEHDQAN